MDVQQEIERLEREIKRLNSQKTDAIANQRLFGIVPKYSILRDLQADAKVYGLSTQGHAKAQQWDSVEHYVDFHFQQANAHYTPEALQAASEDYSLVLFGNDTLPETERYYGLVDKEYQLVYACKAFDKMSQLTPDSMALRSMYGYYFDSDKKVDYAATLEDFVTTQEVYKAADSLSDREAAIVLTNYTLYRIKKYDLLG